MSKKLKEVFTVDLNTQDEDNQGRPVYVVSTRKEAERRVRILNEQEAYGVELTEDKLDISDCDENYSTVEGLLDVMKKITSEKTNIA